MFMLSRRKVTVMQLKVDASAVTTTQPVKVVVPAGISCAQDCWLFSIFFICSVKFL